MDQERLCVVSESSRSPLSPSLSWAFLCLPDRCPCVGQKRRSGNSLKHLSIKACARHTCFSTLESSTFSRVMGDKSSFCGSSVTILYSWFVSFYRSVDLSVCQPTYISLRQVETYHFFVQQNMLTKAKNMLSAC